MKKILVIDDDKIIRILLTKLLQVEGFEVSYADTGDIALKEITKKNYDAVIMDFNLGKVTAEEILLKMKISNIKKPVILISGSDLDELDKFKDSYCVERVLQKPFANKELLNIVKTIIN